MREDDLELARARTRIVENELARVRWELDRLKAQEEILLRIIGAEEAVVHEAIAVVPPDTGPADEEEKVASPLGGRTGGKAKRWQPHEDEILVRYGYKEGEQYLPDRNVWSCYQRQRVLVREGKFEKIRQELMRQPHTDPPSIPEPEPSPHPDTRSVDTSERKEVELPPARKKGLSFEQQLERVARGEVGIVPAFRVNRPDPVQTLGGVGSSML